MKLLKASLILFALSAMLWACGDSGEKVKATPTKPAKAANPNGLTDFEMEHGIGPIKEVLKLSETIDVALAKKGEKTFELKCFQCHRVDSKLVGPQLHDVTKRRKPEYIVNMMLNPEGMIQKHPEAKKLFAQFLTPMANQNLTKDEAMSILEYLRKEAKEVKKGS
ncbi:c-type cytochrome [bacterium]|nr:MAG: c-type cytochrome [bacterium]